MRLPKGFAKNYFTLCAITATVNQVTLSATSVRIETLHLYCNRSTEFETEQELDELEPNSLLTPIISSFRPCHCNCYFLRITKKILTLCSVQKHFFNYFKMLNNSISPP